MKRNIVESYSIEEAFRALNKKSTKKVVESVDLNQPLENFTSADEYYDYLLKVVPKMRSETFEISPEAIKTSADEETAYYSEADVKDWISTVIGDPVYADATAEEMLFEITSAVSPADTCGYGFSFEVPEYELEMQKLDARYGFSNVHEAVKAFSNRANSKAKKKVIESTVESASDAWTYLMYINYTTEDGQRDDAEEVRIIQNSNTYNIEGETVVFKSLYELLMNQIKSAYDRAVEFEKEHPVDNEYSFADEYDVDFVISKKAGDQITSSQKRALKAELGKFSSIESINAASLIVDDLIDEDEAELASGDVEDIIEKATKKVVESASAPVIPAPYDKYFVISDYVPDPDSSGEYQVGEQIEGYDARLVAYLDTKPEYADTYEGWPMLVDDERYPVVEIVGGRMFPVDIEELFGDAVTEAARTLSSSDAYIMVTQGFEDGYYKCQLGRFPDRIDLIDTVLHICNVTDFETYERLKKLPPNAFNKELAAIVNKASDDGLFDDYGIAYIKDKRTGNIIAGVDLQDEIIDMINTYAPSEAAAANAIRALKNNYPFTF